ncbi:MAG: hypothetical protein NC236_02370 [Mycoplasma sp.]|nr:hypothetical protein [Mycoplasma sp.]
MEIAMSSNIKKISFSAILISVQLVLSIFLKINIGVSQLSLDWVFYIVYGLLFSFWGIIPAVISDNLGQLFSGTIGMWMWEYAIITIGIVIITAGIKKILFKKNMWVSLSFLIVSSILFFTTLLINYFMGNYSKYNETFNFNLIVIAGTIFFITLFSLFIFSYVYKKKDSIKEILIISLIVYINQIIFSVIWGPFAFIKYLNHLSGTVYSLSDKYIYYLIPRILKLPIENIIWTTLIYSIYKIFHLFKRDNINKF